MRPTWTPKGALEASKRTLGAENGFRELFGVILDPPKSSKMELKFNQTSSAHVDIYFWLFGGLWGSFGARFGVVLGSILGSRARHAIFAKNSTAPQREQYF